MKKLIAILLGLTLGFGGARYVVERPNERYTSVVATVMPTTVTVFVTYIGTNEETGKLERLQVLGSGVFISPKGHILTCNHLFDHAYKIESVTVETSDGTFMAAEGLTHDEKKDLALIQVNLSGNAYAKIARPDSLVVGQEVIAIGAPLGLSGSVTTGVLSATNRDEINYDMIQMSAPINPGNSGGPLFNLKGEVIGINVNIMLATPIAPIWSGIGYSVSASEINRFLVKYLSQFKGLERI